MIRNMSARCNSFVSSLSFALFTAAATQPPSAFAKPRLVALHVASCAPLSCTQLAHRHLTLPGALQKGQLLGTHPDRGGSMYLKAGKYGPYVEHEGVMATVPKAWAEAGREVTMEAAVEWVDKKRLRGTGGRGGGRGRGAGGRGQAARGRGR